MARTKTKKNVARPQRLCDVCGVLDDQPRHVTSYAKSAKPSMRHIACCAALGCTTCTETEN